MPPWHDPLASYMGSAGHSLRWQVPACVAGEVRGGCTAAYRLLVRCWSQQEGLCCAFRCVLCPRRGVLRRVLVHRLAWGLRALQLALSPASVEGLAKPHSHVCVRGPTACLLYNSTCMRATWDCGGPAAAVSGQKVANMAGRPFALNTCGLLEQYKHWGCQ